MTARKRPRRSSRLPPPEVCAPLVTDAAAVEAGCRFDLDAAERVRLFFRRFFKHSMGRWAGQPFEPLEWQWRRVLAPLFGWLRADGSRRFRRAYIEIPKKNGKSTLCAGIAVYLTVADNEPSAEVYPAACDREQAAIVYRAAEQMVLGSKELRENVELVPSRKRLFVPRTHSFLQALSADVATNEGINWSGLIFDELHAQPNSRLWDCLRYGGAARAQPLLVAITTAGYDRHSVCWVERSYAVKVRDGLIPDIEHLPVIYSGADDGVPPDQVEWENPEVWRRANPSLGTTITEEDMAADAREARESPTRLNAFLRRRLNLWTEQAVRWMPMDAWARCGASFDPETLRGKPCWAGLDLSSTKDIIALVRVWPPESEGGPWRCLCKFWVPGDSAIRRERQDRVPYPQWAREGWIEMTGGNRADYGLIRRRLGELRAFAPIMEIAYDPWNATQLALDLQDQDGFKMIEFRQGFISMNEPMKFLEWLVLGASLAHGGNPVLAWMASNVAASTDPAANIKPDKDKSGEKIDGIVALIMALARARMGQGVPTKSVYEERGILEL